MMEMLLRLRIFPSKSVRSQRRHCFRWCISLDFIFYFAFICLKKEVKTAKGC